jgi:hypothetical protein
MSKNKKYIMYGVALVVAYALYRYYKNSQNPNNASSTIAGPGGQPAATTGDFAAVQGQEQSDVAALQQQNSQLFAQEQSDVQALQGTVTTLKQRLKNQKGQITNLQGNLYNTGVGLGLLQQWQQTTGGPAADLIAQQQAAQDLSIAQKQQQQPY